MATTPTKLAGEDRANALKEIPEWTEVNGRDAIQRKFQFADFKQAWAWMSKVADVADKVRYFGFISFSLDLFLNICNEK